MPYMLAGPSGQTAGIISPDPDAYWCCWSLTPSFDAYNTDVTLLAEDLAAEGKIELPNKKVALISSDNAYSNTIHDGMVKSHARVPRPPDGKPEAVAEGRLEELRRRLWRPHVPDGL